MGDEERPKVPDREQSERAEVGEPRLSETLSDAAIESLLLATEGRPLDSLKRALGAGGAVLERRRAVARWLRDELRGELGERLQQRAEHYREEVTERLQQELTKVIERFDPVEELQRLLSQFKIELQTEISFEAREGGAPWVKPVVKSRAKMVRQRAEAPSEFSTSSPAKEDQKGHSETPSHKKSREDSANRSESSER